jgi:hypothetical protein
MTLLVGKMERGGSHYGSTRTKKWGGNKVNGWGVVWAGLAGNDGVTGDG